MNIVKIKQLSTIFVVVLGLSVGAVAAKATENESTELPSPVSFKCDTQLLKSAELMETIDFELSEKNPVVAYSIPETDSDLIFVFDNVSTSVNMSIIGENDIEYHVGFRGKDNVISVRNSLDMECQFDQFELSLGVIASDNMQQIEAVDNCRGHLEIYRVVN